MQNEPPEIALNKAQCRALGEAIGQGLAGSGTLRELFDTLLLAWSHRRTATENDLWKDKKPSNAVELLKNRVAILRRKLHGQAFPVSKGRECEIVIPKRTPYRIRIVEPQASFLRRLWSSHFGQVGTPVIVHVFERLFFQYKNTIYVRHLKINRPQDAERLLKLLPVRAQEVQAELLQPSLHYVSSGELRAAITLQKLFVNTFQCRAELSDAGDLEGVLHENLILIGSASVGAPEMQPFSSGKYRLVHGGIRPGFHDHSGGEGHRFVHVLLSRRRTGTDGGTRTILEGGHGRAVQGACAALTSDQVARSILEKLGTGNAFPDQFQVVLGVELAFNPRRGVHLPVSTIEILAATPLDADVPKSATKKSRSHGARRAQRAGA